MVLPLACWMSGLLYSRRECIYLCGYIFVPVSNNCEWCCAFSCGIAFVCGNGHSLTCEVENDNKSEFSYSFLPLCYRPGRLHRHCFREEGLGGLVSAYPFLHSLQVSDLGVVCEMVGAAHSQPVFFLQALYCNTRVCDKGGTAAEMVSALWKDIACFLRCVHVWCRSGLVESKIRILISKLEDNTGIELAHVIPTSYSRTNPER